MKIIGIYKSSLCILLEGARIIIQPKLSNSEIFELIVNHDIDVFKSWEEVETAAYGYPF
jgi:hypothetical protein